MHIRYLIKDIRQSKGMTIRELSKRSGVSIGHIADIENEVKVPSFPIVVYIAKALGVPLDEIYIEE